MRLTSSLLTESVNDKAIFKALFVAGYPGSGKAQDINCKVLTSIGWMRIGDISVGDIVITPSNSTAKVTHIHPQGKKDIYKISLFDGRETYCCSNHLWKIHGFRSKVNSTRRNKDGIKQNIRDWSVKTTQELIDRFDTPYLKNRLHLPHPKPLYLDEDCILPVDPYVFGVLLGDGSFRNKVNMTSFTSVDEDIVNEVNIRSIDGYHVSTKQSDVTSHHIKQDVFSKNHKYNHILKEMGMVGLYSHEKYIPEIYKNASISDRFDLIKGLMDTDGYVSKTGMMSYTSTSRRLIDDIRYIIWSLGGNTLLTNKIPFYRDVDDIKKEGKVCYTLNIYHHNQEDLVNLPRKKERASLPVQKRNPNHHLRTRIDSIDYDGNREAVCITLDSEDGLYITDDFIVTHNSTMISMIHDGSLPVMQVNSDVWTEYYIKFDRTAWSDIGKLVKRHSLSNVYHNLNALLPLYVDSTGTNPTLFKNRVSLLKSYGYDVKMIMIDVELDTSQARAKARGEKEGGRKVPAEFIEQAYKQINNDIGMYKKYISDYTTIRNNDGEVGPEFLKKVSNQVFRFFSSPIKNPIGKSIVDYMKKNGYKYYNEIPTEIKTEKGWLSMKKKNLKWY